MIFKIQGVLGVSVNQSKTQYLLRPSTAYLSPDRKSAVFYGDDNSTVKQVPIEDGLLKLEQSELKLEQSEAEIRYFLIQLALQQRPVELHVNEHCTAITGFAYPVPTP